MEYVYLFCLMHLYRYETIDKNAKQASHELIKKCAKGLMDKGVKVRGVALRGDAREEIVYKVCAATISIIVIIARLMMLRLTC